MKIAFVVFILLSFSVSAANLTITVAEGSGKDKYCLDTCSNTDELLFTENSTIYLQFDITAILDDYTLTKAMLLLKYKDNASSSVGFAELYEADSGWAEDNDAMPAATGTLIGALDNQTNPMNSETWFGVSSSALLTKVEAWDAGSTNNGLLISDIGSDFTAFSGESSDPPMLYIEYRSFCADDDNDGFGVGDCDFLDCNDTNAAINPNATETCNYIDDDCNSAIDDTGTSCQTCQAMGGTVCNLTEYCNGNYLDALDSDLCCMICSPACQEGATRSCGNDTGACEFGDQTCSNNVWSECINQLLATIEVCNTIDDDCNGVVDDLDNCGCFNGTASSREIFDSIDNDCDGEIDEDSTCEAQFGFQCAEHETCPGEVLTDTDVQLCCMVKCTSDCTANQTKKCGSNVGECREGSISCFNGKWGNCTGSIGPTEERCNTLDDDCNAFVDDIDGYTSATTTKCKCTETDPDEELCNEIDDDCDGVIDNDCTKISEACSDGIKNYNEETIDCGGDCGSCEEDPKKGGFIEQPAEEQKTEKKSSVFIYIILGVVLLAVLAVGFVIIQMFRPQKPPQQNTNQNNYQNYQTNQGYTNQNYQNYPRY